MARIRTIKPEFFRHEALQDLEAAHPKAYTMLVFAGLWGHCDKAGTFEWKPRSLKLDILPFLGFDMAETLGLLEKAGFIVRYEVDGVMFGNIPTFTEHQRITGKEAESPVKHPGIGRESPENHPDAQEGKGRERELGKGTEGNDDTLRARAPDPVPDGLDLEVWRRWLAYRAQIRKPIKAASMTEAMKKLAAFGADQAAVVAQSIAQGWQGLFALKDVPHGTRAPAPERTWRPEDDDSEAQHARA